MLTRKQRWRRVRVVRASHLESLGVAYGSASEVSPKLARSSEDDQRGLYTYDAWTAYGLGVLRSLFSGGRAAGVVATVNCAARERCATEGCVADCDWKAHEFERNRASTISCASRIKINRVRFHNEVRVVLVPCKHEMLEVKADVWWGEQDYFNFRREYILSTRDGSLDSEKALDDGGPLSPTVCAVEAVALDVVASDSASNSLTSPPIQPPSIPAASSIPSCVHSGVSTPHLGSLSPEPRLLSSSPILPEGSFCDDGASLKPENSTRGTRTTAESARLSCGADPQCTTTRNESPTADIERDHRSEGSAGNLCRAADEFDIGLCDEDRETTLTDDRKEIRRHQALVALRYSFDALADTEATSIGSLDTTPQNAGAERCEEQHRPSLCLRAGRGPKSSPLAFLGSTPIRRVASF